MQQTCERSRKGMILLGHLMGQSDRVNICALHENKNLRLIIQAYAFAYARAREHMLLAQQQQIICVSL